jgi:tetratricopeptide (TPR) repeat protein
MIRFEALAAVVATCMVATMAGASENRAAVCEQLWKQESAKAIHGGASPDFPQLLARWLSHGPQCAGTVAYEARLAIAYVAAGRPDEAREVLAPMRGIQSEYAHLVELAALQLDYFAVAKGTITDDRLKGLESQFRTYVRKHPHVPEGYAQLGALQTMLGKHAEAVGSLSAALKSSMDLAGVHRNLTISYAALGRYEEAVRSADEAVDLGPDMLSDAAFVYAAAKASAAVGKISAAVTVLNVIATKRPELREDPGFWDAANFVKARKAAARR